MHAKSKIDSDRNELLDELVERGVANSDVVTRALALSERTGITVLGALSQLHTASEEIFADVVATNFELARAIDDDFEFVDLDQFRVSLKFLKSSRCCPMCKRDDGVTVALVDPSDEYLAQALAMAFGKPLLVRVATPAQIERVIERFYETSDDAITDMVVEMGNGNEEDNVELLIGLANKTPLVRLVDALIIRAVGLRASDIHIEPFEKKLKVRFRIDGMLQDFEAPPAHSSKAVISRLKIMARLNIAERRLPQDGRIHFPLQGRVIDLRVSTVPTMHGESVVLRILDKETLPLNFGALGFSGPPAAALHAALDQPHGIILVTGPTGSGKTTSLYAALQGLNRPQRKILTVEDPVEYQLEGVNQIQVKAQIDLTFASALRSIVRQDPDIIMIGEMRDLETASIAVQAALTGHLVLSTLHTNDAGSSITRLLDMGVEDYLLTSTINGVVAQRLVRTLCPECAESYVPDPRLIEELGLAALSEDGGVRLRRARGCARCAGSGYKGRTIIFEFLLMSDAIRHLVLERADAATLQKAACAAGMMTMRQDGFVKAMAGLTTIEEVVRVTQLS